MTTELEATQPTSALLVNAAAPRITPAEYISAMVTGGGTPAVRAAIAQQGTGDTPGIMPEPLVGSVFSDLAGRRPLIDALGTLAMPQGGTTFYRRTITQHVSVGEQLTEFAELSSQKMTIGRIQVDKGTYGGAVSLSNQEISWGDPDSVQLVWNDFARVYAKQTETAVCAALATAASVTDTITDWTDGDELLDAFYDASVTISSAVDEMPTHLFLSAQKWAALGKAKTANGDRLFPNVGPSNAAGTMNPGAFTIGSFPFTVVVSPRFASGVAILGNPIGFEVYEQMVGQLSADQPTSLSVELAWYGFLATATIDSGAFVKFV